MPNLQAIADRLEIEALRSELTDAAMTRDYDRFASLLTQDGPWRIPDVNVRYLDTTPLAGIGRTHGDPVLMRTTPQSVEA